MSGYEQESQATNVGQNGAIRASRWTSDDVAAIAAMPVPQAALISADQAAPMVAGLALWDLWPVQTDEGALAQVAGGTLWVILSAKRHDDPNARHDMARMRLFHQCGETWRDCGLLLPDGFAPGSREWSGSTRLDPATGCVTLWFTAAGRREGGPPFEQRLFQASGQIDLTGDLPRISGWTGLCECVGNQRAFYADTAIVQGAPGRIKGFRDPFWFRDPQTGTGYLLFTASLPGQVSDHDGVIGIAQADGSIFAALPPLVDATGVSNELELPHVLYRDGQYYLFWNTQASVFVPGGPAGPTGLYGMVAPSLFGPYEPLNRSGLVLANPVAEPRQAYGWRVLPSLEVISFVDYWGLKGRDTDASPALRATQFGGTVAPMSRIEIIGKTTRIVATGP
ncbi:MAG: hypothetical protein RL367_797 [Pseudomonadota bacterium]|jgi:levansucrase